MAAEWRIQEQMLQTVADALGPELLRQIAFVGGCTTALLAHRDFACAVQSAARQQQAREELIFQRLEAIALPPAQQ